ncbi:unnamed protein product [Didymodactylos carnosus]|uniref:SET domain-containing protein n=1 Tax=Didymodactylos carnosus TaxID=1234261 RepID=A0A815DZL0_9BILA|nr:unnamed protein product [Didymodactylos carnosus]CAF1358663.1 unnamed protein product [Didymodactylos carnosus]CAF4132039.1 unnamed protein product [Didymodactylos carnosus]CAF4169002.1 unnamed protein product [Didymodactylos carnosus]
MSATTRQLTLPDSNWFMIKLSTDKVGYGMFAKRDIPCATVILREKPLFQWTDCQMMRTEYEKLDREKKRLFSQLSGSQSSNNGDILDVCQTNCIQLGTTPSSGIFHQMSFVNHDCEGNSFWKWFPRNGEQRLFADRRIKCGEEILVPYHSFMPRNERQNLLKSFYNFNCQCKVCERQLRDNGVSDKKWSDFERNREYVFYSMQTNPSESIKLCDELIDFVKDEYHSSLSLMPDLQFIAGQVALIGLGDMERAAHHLKIAIDLKSFIEGEDADLSSHLKIVALLPVEYHQQFKNYVKKQ